MIWRQNSTATKQQPGEHRTGVPLPLAHLDRLDLEPRQVARWSAGLVILGLGLRIFFYVLCMPIWTDEAKLAFNWVWRGYRELLEPLAYGQIAPIPFLWVQEFISRALGFSEYTLRLLPLAAALLGVLLMRRLAFRLMSGAPALLALAWFVVSYYPVRHSAELKPYATDLLASLVLTGLAVEWLSAPRARWLWALAMATPLAVAFSYPAVFTAAGVLAALAFAVWRQQEGTAKLAWTVAAFSGAACFLASYLLVGAKHQAAREVVGARWDGGFPPLGDALGSLLWLISSHTGRTFGYPLGGENGGSVLTFCLVVAGTIALVRARAWTVLAVLLLPFVAQMAAAILQRYPYGGSGRVSQHLVPAICLLAAIGVTHLTGRLARAARGRRWQLGVLLFLGAFGVLLAVAAFVHPYRDEPDREARQVARWLWREKATEGILLDAWADLRLPFAQPQSEWIPGAASYWVNQQIYSERRHNDAVADLKTASSQENLFVVFTSSIAEQQAEPLARWLDHIGQRFRLVGVETVELGGFAAQHGQGESLRLYTFEPRFEV